MPDKEIMLQIKTLNDQLGHRSLDALAKAEAEGSADAAWPLRGALAELSGNWRTLADLYEKAKGKGFKTIYIEPLRHAAAELDKVIKGLEQPRPVALGELRPTSAPPASGAHLDAGLDEPVHRFVPGADGRTCYAPIDRMPGATEPCSRFPSHPAHRLDGPTERPGLDALIAEAASVTRSAADFPGQASGDEVAAYLRGEVDDLPGAPPLGPSSVRDQTEPADAFKAFGAAVSGMLDATMAQVVKEFPDTDPPPADVERIVSGVINESADAWAMGSAKESASMTTPPANYEEQRALLDASLNNIPPFVPPVPLLGQPGDAGRGYDHTYIPQGGVPLSFAELLTPVPAVALPSHLSHSQIETIADCPTKYRAQRLPRNADAVNGRAATLPEIPQWALIGGHAFHAAVEQIEREPVQPSAGWQADHLWRHHFDVEVQMTEASQPVPRSRWRASKRGAEGETWWNANGPEMLRRYLAARPDEPTASLPASPPDPLGALEDAIEIERAVDVPTGYGPVQYRAIIDRVTVRHDPRPGGVTLVIRDYKTGDRMPSDTQQLGEYASVLRLLGVPPQIKIVGTFFNAHKGTWTPEVDLDEAWPAEWFTYLVTTGHAQRLALTQGPTPARPSPFCGGCSVRWACPVKNPGARR